jgi:hypothetical protein
MPSIAAQCARASTFAVPRAIHRDEALARQGRAEVFRKGVRIRVRTVERSVNSDAASAFEGFPPAGSFFARQIAV